MYLRHHRSDGLSTRYVAAEQKFQYCSYIVSNATQLMFHNLVNSLHIPLTIPSYFSQWQCLFPDELSDYCMKMLIVWNRQPRAQVDQHLLLLWIRTEQLLLCFLEHLNCLLISSNSILRFEMCIFWFQELSTCWSVSCLSPQKFCPQNHKDHSCWVWEENAHISEWVQVCNRRTLENH